MEIRPGKLLQRDPQPTAPVPRPPLYTTRETMVSSLWLTVIALSDQTYKGILGHADKFFASVMESQPESLQCGRGCSLCCYGLFEISSADVPVIAEGLAALHPARRKKIIRRAQEIIETTAHPSLRESSPDEKAEFFDRTASVACPSLDESGACMIYESRPLVCRTFGLPVKNGEKYIGDVCELNFTAASDEQKNAASWDLQWEDALGPEDEYTVPEAIVLAARLRGWLTVKQ